MKTPAKKATPVAKLKAPVEAKTITDTKAAKPKLSNNGVPVDNGVSIDGSKPTNLGDWDDNGKPGGDAKALGTEARPMPKDFAPTITVEGSRVVARQDGIEVPFVNTDDKAAYAERAEAQRQALWAALEYRRVRGLKA